MVRTAIREPDQGSDVPCGGCTACCTSSQFVHIEPDEADTLAHIPTALRFPAPGLPPGHVVLGYDERGHCPMLGADGCTIYAHRPRTCRTYDCRVFPATGVEPGGRQVEIAVRARRWRFDEPTAADRADRSAVRAAAAWIQEHASQLGRDLPADPTRVAVLAIEISGLFVGPDGPVDPPRASVEAALRAT
jgi:uncharacterized protein